MLARGIDRTRVAVDPLDLFEGVGDRGLHPHPEHIELDEPHVVHIVFIELAHGQTHAGRLDRGAVQQGAVRKDHPARVHRDVAGQPVQAFCEVDE